MRETLLDYIQCPICCSCNFKITVLERNEQEIREGQVICLNCNHRYPVHNGIINLLPNPSEVIKNEQKGWGELLGETTDELIDTMLKLPYYEGEIWLTTHQNFDAALAGIDVAGKSVLDIGAGRCWSTRWMVKEKAGDAIAIDILLDKFIGLETADIFLEHDGIHFERVLGDMNDLPVKPGTFDIVFMTGTLHHSSDINLAMQQVACALKPGGLAIITNEPVCSLLRSKKMIIGRVEVEHGINEHVYTIFEYLWAVYRAGLRPKLRFPASIRTGVSNHAPNTKQEMGIIGYQIISLLRKFKVGCQLSEGVLLPFLYLLSSMPLVIVAHKH